MTATLRLILAAAVTAAVSLSASPAHATSVTSEQLAQLANDAIDDPAALQELREVDEVDGKPADVDRVLGDASGEELERRLALLATYGQPENAPNDPDQAKERAGEILRGERYRESETPRPLKGLGDRIGEWLEPVGRFFERIGRATPGGPVVLMAILAVLLAVIGGAAARRADANRPVGRGAVGHEGGFGTKGPRELEDEADAAERSGDLDEAVRLRFVAGLLRLDAEGVIDYAPSATSSEIRREVRSPIFDRLAATFDQIVYGRRPAGPSDVEEARAGWTQLFGKRRTA